MNISVSTASRIAVTIVIGDTSSVNDVLAQVNRVLMQRAQILDHSDDTRHQALANNMWKVRSEIIQFLSDRLN